MKKSNAGFTLVEVIVSIAILSIIITPIGFMLINQSKSTKDNQNITFVQQNAQLAMSSFRTKCIPASSVITIENESGLSVLSESTANVQFSKLVLKNIHTGESTTYEYNSSTHTLRYNGADIATGIKVLVSPLPDTSNYANCKGLKINIESSKSDAGTKKTHNLKLENQFYFRNAAK